MAPEARSRRPRRAAALAVAVLAVVAAVAAPSAVAGDLDAAQQQRLAALAASVKQIETNVTLAQQAAGPGDGRIPPAKARLVQTRLASPASLVPQAREALRALPADHADVAALVGRLDAAAASIAALEARMGAAPAAPATGAGTKLDHVQAKALADGTFHVREVVGLAAAVDEVAKEAAAAADPDALDHRRIAAALNTVAKARERAAQARAHLDPLPADGAGVKAARDELAAGLASLATSEAKLKPLHERLQVLVDPATHPTLDADVRRLQELGQAYGDPANTFGGDRRRAAALVAELPAAVAEHERLVKAYAALVRQRTDDGRRVEGAARFCGEALARFGAATDAQRAAAPAAVDAAFAALGRLVETAVKEEKPAFFGGGIPQQVDVVEGEVVLLSALDAKAGAAAAERLAKAKADLATTQASLAAKIVEANVLPPDAYAGADRAALEAEAAAAWKRLQPDAVVLATRIPSSAWRRETMWRRQGNTWYRVDRSRLQVQLIVGWDDARAVIRPVDLWIDHQAGDERSAVPMDAPKDPVPPHRLLLRSVMR
ncbi:MAG: hypothetical protein JNM10_14935 [Planctomycetia bacterium]|nr:hypothetical protein [Planctomycetia bacterium]